MSEEREHPAGPDQPDDGGFAEGVEDEGVEDEVQSDFARGMSDTEPDPEAAEGRFSRGQEDPESELESEGGSFGDVEK